MLPVGVTMVAAFVVLLLLALPRGGEARWIVAGSFGRASAYAVMLVALLMAGVALIVAGYQAS